MNLDKNAEKLRKKLIREQLKRIQPGECQKYIRLVIDSNIAQSPIGRELLLHIESSELKYVTRNLAKDCILWERLTGQQTFVSSNANQDQEDDNSNTPPVLSNKWQLEKQLIRIFTTQNLLESIRTKSLNSIIEQLKSTYPDMRLTLIFPSIPAKSSNNMHLERETLVTELQIYHECNVLQIKSQAAVILETLKRFNKAVAEGPYKKHKSEAQDGFKKYLINDNRHCVRVEGINGLSRLWQQHLNRLPMITLEVAEAIRAHYVCPKRIIDDIDEHPDVSATIANIQINRGAGVLNTNRRIGNVLSNKLIKLYQTRNPMDLL